MVMPAIAPHADGFAWRHRARFGAVLAVVVLAPGLALAQGAGYAPAYPPGYLAAQQPLPGAVPTPVTAVPMAPPGTAVPTAPPGTASTAPDTADLQYIAKPLPAPDLAPNSPPRAYLQAAQAALATGQDGEAQQAMEMAQTRLLDRSVPLGQTDTPSANPAVSKIGVALTRLEAGDRPGAMQALDAVLSMLGPK